MDILDIDEALKDDSFIFLEDKTHDDISNILQQWKSNNYLPLPSSSAAQTQQQEQAYKLDSRTFTRPKRKSAQNLDLQFTNTATASQFAQRQPNNHFLQQQEQQQQYQHQHLGLHPQHRHQNDTNSQTDNPMLNMEIGGLVTNMHNSFLHDTSPPFSSMDTSMDRMNNSLITSADFSNINFLQSPNSLDFSGSEMNRHLNEFNMMGKITSDGYTLSDMIRDRKALESLTMSSEGTLIKDSQIGQIDDISLTLCKTASGCSTMDNSTDSVEGNNDTFEIRNSDRTFDSGVIKDKQSTIGNNHTMVLTDEMIGDISYNLVENSLYGSMTSEQLAANVTQNLAQSKQSSLDISNKAELGQLDETVCISAKNASATTCEKSNSTFDNQQNITPNNHCETPEGAEKRSMAMKFYESTPSVRSNKQHFTPASILAEDVNLSPIIASSAAVPHDGELSKSKTNNIHTRTFSGNLPMNVTVDMIEHIKNPNNTYDQQFGIYEEHSQASLEMRNVMDLAQAEANLLASNNNEEEFDHMLDEFSKVELNAEQLKMKKSLDSIKKRFTYGSNKEKMQQREISREAKDMREMLRVSADLLGDEDLSAKDYLNMTEVSGGKADASTPIERVIESQHALYDAVEGLKSPLKDSVASSSSITESRLSNGLSASSVSSASNGGERLLSRRSRLYDDFNLSTLSSGSGYGTKTSLGSSFTVHKDDDAYSGNVRPIITDETVNVCGATALEMVQEKTESVAEEAHEPEQTTCNPNNTTAAAQYRLAEKRERDRDRFKTMKINKNRNDVGVNQVEEIELNVPCIDDYGVDVNGVSDREVQQTNQRCSRRDKTVSPVFNNNKSEIEIVDMNESNSKTNPNYLTYKKPKDKLTNVRNLPEIAPDSTNTTALACNVVSNLSKPRSLSRPRFLSGLTKFSAVSKATSADELQKSVPRQTNQNSITAPLTGGISKGCSAINIAPNLTQISDKTRQPSSAELKSPMGIKSKSFHNLSSNHTLTSTQMGIGVGIPVPKTVGLRKPSATSTEKLAKPTSNRHSMVINSSNLQQPSVQSNSEEGIFKVPKLASGLRAPGGGTSVNGPKRAGLVRPSSGYYSLSVTAKGVQQANTDADKDTGRHSPTDSMSSTSSRGSAQSVNKAVGISALLGNNASMKVNSSAAPALTKITLGATGIPKPSGLRPPSSIKRSGLPRPSSVLK